MILRLYSMEIPVLFTVAAHPVHADTGTTVLEGAVRRTVCARPYHGIRSAPLIFCACPILKAANQLHRSTLPF